MDVPNCCCYFSCCCCLLCCCLLLLLLLLLPAALQRHLSELVAASQPGDVLFFHYSGHGTQVSMSELFAHELNDRRTCTDRHL
jgi:hypothetical protein